MFWKKSFKSKKRKSAKNWPFQAWIFIIDIYKGILSKTLPYPYLHLLVLTILCLNNPCYSRYLVDQIAVTIKNFSSPDSNPSGIIGSIRSAHPYSRRVYGFFGLSYQIGWGQVWPYSAYFEYKIDIRLCECIADTTCFIKRERQKDNPS